MGEQAPCPNCAELEALFALQRTRTAEATAAWREATGRHDVSPDLGDLLAWLLRERAEAEEMVAELVAEACGQADDTVDSMARRTYADALHWLAVRGRCRIRTECGRRILGRLTSPRGAR